MKRTLSIFMAIICLSLFSCQSKQEEMDPGITIQDMHRALICATRTQGADIAKGIFKKNFAILLVSKKISLDKDTALARFYFSSMNEIDEEVKNQNREERY